MKHLAEFAAKVAAMPDADRAALAMKMPVTTIEGHPLSLRNNILCVLQSPDPITIVGGFRQWLAAGRCVRKGEKALYILYPCSKKDDSDARIFFREAAIFDVSQTEVSTDGTSNPLTT